MVPRRQPVKELVAARKITTPTTILKSGSRRPLKKLSNLKSVLHSVRCCIAGAHPRAGCDLRSSGPFSASNVLFHFYSWHFFNNLAVNFSVPRFNTWRWRNSRNWGGSFNCTQNLNWQSLAICTYFRLLLSRINVWWWITDISDFIRVPFHGRQSRHRQSIYHVNRTWYID